MAKILFMVLLLILEQTAAFYDESCEAEESESHDQQGASGREDINQAAAASQNIEG